MADVFPFNAYFSDIQPLFKTDGEGDAEDKVVAEKCLFHIEALFTELRDYRPFEVLRTNGMRTDYFLAKQVLLAFECMTVYQARDLAWYSQVCCTRSAMKIFICFF